MRTKRGTRSTKSRTAARDRECWHCCEKITKGDKYVNKQQRYDATIMTFSYHPKCYAKELYHNRQGAA